MTLQHRCTLHKRHLDARRATILHCAASKHFLDFIFGQFEHQQLFFMCNQYTSHVVTRVEHNEAWYERPTLSCHAITGMTHSATVSHANVAIFWNPNTEYPG